MNSPKPSNNTPKIIAFFAALFVVLVIATLFSRRSSSSSNSGGLPALSASMEDLKDSLKLDIPLSLGGDEASTGGGIGGGDPMEGAAPDDEGGGGGGAGTNTSGIGDKGGSGPGFTGDGAGGNGTALSGSRSERGSTTSGKGGFGSASAAPLSQSKPQAYSGFSSGTSQADSIVPFGSADAGSGGGASETTTPQLDRSLITWENENARGMSASVPVITVQRRTIERSLTLPGIVVAPRQVSLYALESGKITDLRKHPGDPVMKSEIVAMISSNEQGAYAESVPLRSVTGGIVQETLRKIGDTVSADTIVYTINDTSVLLVETYLPEHYVRSTAKGMVTEIKLDGFPGERWPGVVSDISTVIESTSRSARTQIQFTRRDERILPQTGATVILKLTRANVPVIPKSAVLSDGDSWYVYAVDDSNNAQPRDISTGLDNDTMVEVTSGLSLGERIVGAGQNFLPQSGPIRISNGY